MKSYLLGIRDAIFFPKSNQSKPEVENPYRVDLIPLLKDIEGITYTKNPVFRVIWETMEVDGKIPIFITDAGVQLRSGVFAESVTHKEKSIESAIQFIKDNKHQFVVYQFFKDKLSDDVVRELKRKSNEFIGIRGAFKPGSIHPHAITVDFIPELKKLDGVMFSSLPAGAVDWERREIAIYTGEQMGSRFEPFVSRTSTFQNLDKVIEFVNNNKHQIIVHTCHLQSIDESKCNPGDCLDPRPMLRYARKIGAELIKT